MKENMPIIAAIESNNKDSIKISVANNKPYNITVKSIRVKKKKGLFFFKEKSQWIPTTSSKSLSVHPGDTVVNLKHLVIKDMEDFHISIPCIEKQSVYKIFVETSGGQCQSIYHCGSKHQAE